jgi:predicted nucleotidyltransferase
MFYGDVFKALNRARVRYVVAGGVAVVLYGFLRYTKDVDLIVHLQEENLARLFDALLKIGYYPKAPVSKEQFVDAKIRERWRKEKGMIVFSFYHKSDPFKAIDMFIEEPMCFSLLHKNRTIVKSEGVRVPLISLDHLRILKKRAGRPHDLDDLEQLNAIKRFRNK